MTDVTLTSEHLTCEISASGAELQRLVRADGTELLWDGDPTWWSGRAPILFPVVGMLADGRYRWQGRDHVMAKHGFARGKLFDLVTRDDRSATFKLGPDMDTHAAYPFAFALDVRFTLGEALEVEAQVRNDGDGPMPFSLGFHPALRWPVKKDAYLDFDSREAGPVWRLDRDGLIARHEPLPGDGRRMMLDDMLFADDAMILRDVASRSVRFVSGGQAVRVAWDNLPDLGIWTKPGAPYLCIEPWAGMADPAGFAGPIEEKPGIVMLAPGETWSAAMTIAPD